jgi:hypothetical protein
MTAQIPALSLQKEGNFSKGETNGKERFWKDFQHIVQGALNRHNVKIVVDNFTHGI